MVQEPRGYGDRSTCCVFSAGNRPASCHRLKPARQKQAVPTPVSVALWCVAGSPQHQRQWSEDVAGFPAAQPWACLAPGGLVGLEQRLPALPPHRAAPGGLCHICAACSGDVKVWGVCHRMGDTRSCFLEREGGDAV